MNATHTTITNDPGIVTQIDLLRVDPTHQLFVLEQMQHAVSILSQQPGFLSVNLHRSIDVQNLIVNYIQWTSKASLEAAEHLPAYQQALVMNDNINSRRIASWENLTLRERDAS